MLKSMDLVYFLGNTVLLTDFSTRVDENVSNFAWWDLKQFKEERNEKKEEEEQSLTNSVCKQASEQVSKQRKIILHHPFARI